MLSLLLFSKKTHLLIDYRRYKCWIVGIKMAVYLIVIICGTWQYDICENEFTPNVMYKSICINVCTVTIKFRFNG